MCAMVSANDVNTLGGVFWRFGVPKASMRLVPWHKSWLSCPAYPPT